MKIIFILMEIALVLSLVANAVAIGLLLYRVDAAYMSWGNLFGCVVLGWYLKARLD